MNRFPSQQIKVANKAGEFILPVSQTEELFTNRARLSGGGNEAKMSMTRSGKLLD